MAITVKTKFLDVDTILVRAYIYSLADALTNTTGVTLDIYNPAGTKVVDGAAMTCTATGTYDYYYHKGSTEAALTAGKYRGVIKAVDGSGTDAVYSTGSFGFEVE
jgi:hypothetical protein